MAMAVLDVLDEIRHRLDDVGGDMGNPPAGYYARWQYDDSGCLWKNRELVAYLNEAIIDVGLRKPIYDADDATICTISVVSGTRVYPIHPLIISIQEVHLLSSGLSLIKTTTKRMRELIGRYRPTENWRVLPGAVTHYLEDEADRKISLYHMPNTPDTLHLAVRRRFKDAVSWSAIANEATPTALLADIPDVYRSALVYGVTALAYQKRDSDTFNVDLAKEAEQRVEVAIGPKISFAQHEQDRLSANLWRSKGNRETFSPLAKPPSADPSQAQVGE